jgi:hypothetical protein
VDECAKHKNKFEDFIDTIHDQSERSGSVESGYKEEDVDEYPRVDKKRSIKIKNKDDLMSLLTRNMKIKSNMKTTRF